MLSRLTGQLLICGLRAYQIVLAPHLGPCCRFTPSCSVYAIEAIGRHGPIRGTWLACRRLWRCRPFGPCGDDPVPPPRARNSHLKLSCTGNT